MINALKLIHAQHRELKYNHWPSYTIAPRCRHVIPELRSGMCRNFSLQLIIPSFCLQYKLICGSYEQHE